MNVSAVQGGAAAIAATRSQAAPRQVAASARAAADAVQKPAGGDGDGDHGVEPTGQKLDVRG